MTHPDSFSGISASVVSLLFGTAQMQLQKEPIPFMPFCDLFQVYAYQKDNRFILIRTADIKHWETDLSTIHRLAMRYSRQLLGLTFAPLEQILAPAGICPAPSGCPDAYVLTNAAGSYGASAVLYPGALSAIGARLGCDFYLLPASLHEMIILPVSDEADPSALRHLLREMNDTYLSFHERLSDSLYRYSRTDDRVFICC